METAGIKREVKMAMMAMTTMSSTSVKPCGTRRRLDRRKRLERTKHSLCPNENCPLPDSHYHLKNGNLLQVSGENAKQRLRFQRADSFLAEAIIGSLRVIEYVANDGQKFAPEIDRRVFLREGVRLAFDAGRNVVDEIDFVEC